MLLNLCNILLRNALENLKMRKREFFVYEFAVFSEPVHLVEAFCDTALN